MDFPLTYPFFLSLHPEFLTWNPLFKYQCLLPFDLYSFVLSIICSVSDNSYHFWWLQLFCRNWKCPRFLQSKAFLYLLFFYLKYHSYKHPKLYLLPIFLFFTYGGGSLVTKSCPPLVTPWLVTCQSALFIFQARILEWVAIFFSRGSSQPRDWTWVFCLAGRFFYWLSHQGTFFSHVAPLHFPALVKSSCISSFTCEWLKVSSCYNWWIF